MGALGWTPEVFWNSSMKDVGIAISGYKEHLHNLFMVTMEGARLSGAMSIAPYTKRDPMRIVKFDWDKKDKKLSAEEWDQFIKKVDDMEAREGW